MSRETIRFSNLRMKSTISGQWKRRETHLSYLDFLYNFDKFESNKKERDIGVDRAYSIRSLVPGAQNSSYEASDEFAIHTAPFLASSPSRSKEERVLTPMEVSDRVLPSIRSLRAFKIDTIPDRDVAKLREPELIPEVRIPLANC